MHLARGYVGTGKECLCYLRDRRPAGADLTDLKIGHYIGVQLH
jgi:hypothetical protein